MYIGGAVKAQVRSCTSATAVRSFARAKDEAVPFDCSSVYSSAIHHVSLLTSRSACLRGRSNNGVRQRVLWMQAAVKLIAAAESEV